MRQRIRYVKTPDDVRVAWAETGRGRVLVKPANWLTHIEHEWESPVWRHWIRFLSTHFRLVRYDERGSGMTDWHVGELSRSRWVADLESVVEAVGVQEPAVVLGISQGAATAVAYAAHHPERVAQLIVYGGYARGWARRGEPETERYYRAILELMRWGWDSDNSTFRQIFTSRFIPDATEEQIGWFNELCRRTASAETAVKLLEARGRLDASGLLAKVRAPTLVLHARGDEVVPAGEGRLIASEIPDATFVELDSRNHILLEHEPAWRVLQDRVLEFTGKSAPSAPLSAELSSREAAVLARMAKGLTNAQIADRLNLSEKTVRNHTSSLFAKLGVSSRAQAIVLARDRGIGG